MSPKVFNASAIAARVASLRMTAPAAALMYMVLVPCSVERPTNTPRSRAFSAASARARAGSACIFAAWTILFSRYGVIESIRGATRWST